MITANRNSKLRKATDLELTTIIAAIKDSIGNVYAERHNNLTEAREAIADAVLRVRQLTGILEVRNMKRNS